MFIQQQLGFESGLILLIVMLITGLITALGALANFLRDKKRREVMTEFSEKIGLQYVPHADSALVRRFSGFKLFSIGRAKKIKNLIHGDSGDEWMSLLDFQYTVGSGKSQSIHRQTVAAIETENLNVPAFYLRPGGFFQRFGSVFGMKEVDFDLHPTFSRSQVMQAADEEAIKNFFDNRLLDYFESNELCLEVSPGKMICYIPKRSYRLDEMEVFMQQAFEIYSQLIERAQVRNP